MDDRRTELRRLIGALHVTLALVAVGALVVTTTEERREHAGQIVAGVVIALTIAWTLLLLGWLQRRDGHLTDLQRALIAISRRELPPAGLEELLLQRCRLLLRRRWLVPLTTGLAGVELGLAPFEHDPRWRVLLGLGFLVNAGLQWRQRSNARLMLTRLERRGVTGHLASSL